MTDAKRPSSRKTPKTAPAGLSPGALSILEARTRRLAQPAQAPRTETATSYLLLPLGENLYGLPLHEVERVRPLDRMSPTGVPGDVIGLVAEGGRIRQVLDLAALVGAPPPGEVPHGYLAILSAHKELALRLGERPLAIEAEPADSGRLRVLTAGLHQGKTAAILSLTDLLSGVAPTGA